MTYHVPDFFFVIYLAYMNMFVVNKENFYLVPQFMDQGILTYVFINHVSQILENFPKKLKDILTIFSKPKNKLTFFFKPFHLYFKPMDQ